MADSRVETQELTLQIAPLVYACFRSSDPSYPADSATTKRCAAAKRPPKSLIRLLNGTKDCGFSRLGEIVGEYGILEKRREPGLFGLYERVRDRSSPESRSANRHVPAVAPAIEFAPPKNAARSKLNLEKIRASLDLICPNCGARISPEHQHRIDWDHLKCPVCLQNFVPRARSAEVNE
jgi:hypothetical protein